MQLNLEILMNIQNSIEKTDVLSFDLAQSVEYLDIIPYRHDVPI